MVFVWLFLQLDPTHQIADALHMLQALLEDAAAAAEIVIVLLCELLIGRFFRRDGFYRDLHLARCQLSRHEIVVCHHFGLELLG